MYFQNLPQHVKDAIVKLTKDEIFQERFRTDEVLDKLDEEAASPSNSYSELLSITNKRITICGKRYNNITPLMWSFLWSLESPIVYQEARDKISQADIDLFFYILENGIGDGEAVNLAAQSFGYCVSHDMRGEEITQTLFALIDLAFSPLKLFPYSGKTVNSNEKSIFDADWLTSIVAKVHYVTGYTPDYIMNEMTMTAACYYFCQYARIQGVENIARRLPEEIIKAQDERSVQLILDRLIELNVINESETEEMFRIMTTSPETNK